MFATIKSLIPEPRQGDQPRRYVGRHRLPDSVSQVTPVQPVSPVSPAPLATAVTAVAEDEKTPAETTAA
jgi:hypothetical protein